MGISLTGASQTSSSTPISAARDILERGAGNSTDTFARVLRAAGLPHVWDMDGGGPGLEVGCNGGHNFDCWKLALDRDGENITARIR